MFKLLLAASAAALLAGNASATTVDGTLDASYGAPTAHVNYDVNAPDSNFGTPTNASHYAAYDIYLTSDANNVYGFIQADRATGLDFANLYFDLDPASANGSDLGFEIGNDDAFIPQTGQKASNLPGITSATSADGTAFEFSIANDLFTQPIGDLVYVSNTSFPAIGDSVVLRLSQSMGYSVAGGDSYGPNRLGAVVLGGAPAAAVPEPSLWAMMILGFGLVGAALRRRTGRAAFA